MELTLRKIKGVWVSIYAPRKREFGRAIQELIPAVLLIGLFIVLCFVMGLSQ